MNAVSFDPPALRAVVLGCGSKLGTFETVDGDGDGSPVAMKPPGSFGKRLDAISYKMV